MKNYKNLLKYVLCSITFMLLISSCTINKTTEKRTITVSGNGIVKVVPDTAILEFEVYTTSWIAQTALDDNNTIMSRVIKTLTDNNIAEENLKTTKYRLEQEFSWQNGKRINGRYAVRNTVSFSTKNLDSLGKIVDDAVKAGANGIKNIQFTLEDKSTALRQARTKAIKNAQDIASLMAGASGCKLGIPLKITEKNNGYAYEEELANAYTVDKASASIQKGTLDINASVLITFEIE